MFSQLSSLNASRSISEEFNLKYTEVLVDSKEQFWFKWAHVGKFLRLVYIHRSTPKLADEDHKNGVFLHTEWRFHSMNGCAGSKDLQNKAENVLSLTGTFYVIENFQKEKDKALKHAT